MAEFERLRELLLGPEQHSLQQQQEALARLARTQAELPQALPGLLEAAERGSGREALHRALAPVVASALTDAVRRDRRSIVDALFPVIGPTIRKAIAEALRSFVSDLNRALEQSLSLRGWAWRFEAWRGRVPYAQVLLKHTLRYRIDHLFLIERESGLLLHRYSAPELPDLDSDAIAGMLTAIGDFVRDSVHAEAGSDAGLASATVGEHLLQVHEGPVAALACFIRGVTPSALAERLRTRLEDLHRGLDAAGQVQADYDWQAEATRELDIAELGQLGAPESRAAAARWPVLLLALLLLAAAGAWGARRWQLAGEEQRLRTTIAATSGWQLLSLQHAGGWQLRLLRDPDAAATDKLAAAAGLGTEQLRVENVPYLALDDGFVEQRLRRALSPPSTVTLAVSAGQARLSGRASGAWIAQARAYALLLPGVRALDVSGLAQAPDPQLLEEYSALRARSEGLRLLFKRGDTQIESNVLPELARDLHRALELAGMLEQSLSFAVSGWSDEGGSEVRNRRLREQRAQILRQGLLDAGIPPDALRLGDDDARATRPAASVRWLEPPKS